MTTFWRSGHYRTGPGGAQHWVEGHYVSRDDWSRYGVSYEVYRSLLTTARATGSSTARFVYPNASCPVCGANVFFYQNEHGSRVFFDELSPPWPKHPCTDSTPDHRLRNLSRLPGETAPVARATDEITNILAWENAAFTSATRAFETKPGCKPWAMAELGKRVRGKAGTFLILRELTSGTSKKLFMVMASLPRALKEGTLVAINKQRLSYLDLDSMESREVEAKRSRSASAFADALLDPDFTAA